VAAVDDRPPERHAREQVHDVLDVQQRVRLLERVVVDPRQMPDEVREQPEGECRDERHVDALRELRRHGEDEQRGRPLGEDDVLREVRPEERGRRPALERRHEEDEDQREAGGGCERADTSRADDGRIEHGQERHQDERLERRVHPATLPAHGAGVAQW
jgi:hypothetical protein